MDASTGGAGVTERSERVRAHGSAHSSIEQLVALAQRGLPAMYLPDRDAFVQTVRRDPAAPNGVRGEGENLRYAAMVALGTALLGPDAQREILGGRTAREFTGVVAGRGVDAADPGAAALAGWAAAEVAGEFGAGLGERLRREVRDARPAATVDFSWTLTALVAAIPYRVDARGLAEQAADRLLAAQGEHGLFPHMLPREVLPRHRAHVGCFADQVYPIIALARYYSASGDQRALDAANRCARQIVALQGAAGQWWWHYDVRDGAVVEGYPVYSVHQHAMGPMALFELAEAGGECFDAAISAGLEWLRTHPETHDELVDTDLGVVWRKVGRREPRKAVRAVRALTTAVSPGFRLGALDRAFPPGPIDYECRPYELGWLLYAWLYGPTRTPR